MVREDFELGKKIRTLRIACGLTLKKLSQETGFNKSHLSKIENAKSSPPIATLSKIAKVLGVGMSNFFREGSSDGRFVLTRAKEMVKVVRGGNLLGYTYRSLNYTKRLKKLDAFDAFIVTFPLRPRRNNVVFDHEGEEMVYILTGELEFTFDGKVYLLKEGDCIHFDASYPHKALCAGRKDTKALLIVSEMIRSSNLARYGPNRGDKA